MDSRKSEKKKNPNNVSAFPKKPRTSAQFKESPREEAGAEVLEQPGNHLHCAEKGPGEKRQKKENPKKKRKQPDAQMESETEVFKLPGYSAPDCAPRKREKKRQKDLVGHPSKKKCAVHDVCLTTAPAWSPIILKKSKNRKMEAHLKIVHLVRNPSLTQGSKCSLNQRPRRGLNRVINGSDTPQKAPLTQVRKRGAPKVRKLREVGANSHQERPAVTAEQPSEGAGQSFAGSALRAVPNHMRSRQPDGTAESNTEDKASDASLERSPRLEEISGVSDHSQDLFLTQAAVLPGRVSGSSSCASPPPGQEQLARGQKKFRSSGRTDVIQLYSQISAFTVMEKHEAEDSQHHPAVLSDKATQTDGGFSYLSLISVLNKVKALETCSEKPLNLCLPNRVRAGRPRDRTAGNAGDDDVILLSVTPAPLGNSAEGTGRLAFSELRRLEGRFVQTLLNSSYFFKGKGDSKDSIHITPLLKQKQEAKKRRRKSAGFRCKKETGTSRDFA